MTRHVRRRIWVLVAVIFAAVGLFVFVSLLHASNPYELDQGVGQSSFGTFNPSSDIPNFNQPGLTNATGVSSPRGSAIDPTGNRLFIVDSNNNRVIVHQLNGANELVDHVADFVLGQTDFLSDEEETSASNLSNPSDVTFDDANNRLFVADSGNCRVVVFDLSGSIANGMAASWVLGQDDLDQRECEETSDSRFFDTVDGLAYDPDFERLFVSDSSNNRVLAFDVTGTIDNGEAAVAVIGQDDFDTFGNQDVTATRFSRPLGLAYDPTGSRLFVADTQSNNGNRVLVFDASPANLASESDGTGESTNAINVLGQSDFTTNDAAFTPDSQHLYPSSLTFDDLGQRLFVGDIGFYRVLVFDVAIINDFDPADAVLGQDDFTSLDFVTSQDSILPPTGLGYDPVADRLYASDGAPRVMIFDVDSIADGEDAVDMLGQIDYTDTPDYAATGANNSTYPPTGPQASNLNTPTGVAIDETNHRLYAVDSGNNRVLMYDMDDQDIDDLNADIVLGQSLFTTDDAGSGQASLSEPYEVALDVAGNRLFVSDRSNNRVLVYDTSGMDSGDDAARVLGQAAFGTSLAGSGPTGMTAPAGLAYSVTTNTLFVTDAGNNRVLAFAVGAAITDITNGQSAAGVLGQDTLLTGTAATDEDGLSAPDRLALDDGGDRLFVSDSANNRVMVFDVAVVDAGEDAIAVVGQSNFTSAAAAVTVDGLTAPAGIAYDSDRGYLFVGDTGSFRTMIYDTVALASVSQDAVAVLGQMDFTSNVDPTGAPSFDNEFIPSGLTFDVTAGRVYMADSGFHRVVSYAVVRMTTETLPDGLLTAPYSESLGVTGVQSGSEVYTIVSGTLPPGLNVASGFVSGTPTTQGTYPFTIRVTDSEGWGELTYERSYTISIAAATAAYDSAALLGTTNGSLGPHYGSSDPYDTPNHIGFSGQNFVLVDPVGHRVFVSDPDNNRVLVFDLDSSNQFIDRLADRVLGQMDFKGRSGNTTQNGFQLPGGMTLNPGADRLFVADQQNNRVMVFDVATIANGEDAINVLGRPDFTSGFLAGETAQDRLSQPIALAYDGVNDRLFVAENDNRRVTVFDATAITDGELAINEIGQIDFITIEPDSLALDRLNRPRGIAHDAANDLLFVSDPINNRITTYDVDPTVLVANNPATDGPAALNVFGAGPATAQDGTNLPHGLSHDDSPGAERLFVADTSNNRVMVFDLSGGVSDGMAAASVLGQPNFGSSTSDTSIDGLNFPVGASYDATTDQLYVADANNNRVMVFDVDTIVNGEDAVDVAGHLGANGEVRYDVPNANDAPNNRGFDLTVRGSCTALDTVHHRMFVCSGKRVHVLDLDANNEPLDTLADNVIGAPEFFAEFSGITAISMTEPSDLAYDPVNDRLFVSDYDDSRVLVFDTETIIDGEPAINVLGQEDFTSDAEESDDDGMTGPSAIALDTSTQRLFVTDHILSRLQVFDVDPAVLIPNVTLTDGPDAINVVQGGGTPDVSQTIFVFSSQHVGYAGLTIDEARQLMFLNDSDNARILIVPVDTGTLVPNVTDTISAVGVLGQPNFTTRGGGLSQSEIGYGGGEVFYDETANLLFVNDVGQSRTLGFNVTDETSVGIPAAFVIGQPNFISETGTTTSELVGTPRDIMFDTVRRRLSISREDRNSIISFDLVRIPSQSFPTMTAGQPVNEDIITENEQGTVTFELVSGTLPPGLVLGSLTGTPTTPGVYTFTVQANDDNGPIGAPYDRQTLTVTVAPGAGGGGGGGSGGGGGGFIPTPTPTLGATPTPSSGVTPVPTGPVPTPVGSPGSTPVDSPTSSPIAGVSPGATPPGGTPDPSTSPGPGIRSIIGRVLSDDLFARVVEAFSKLVAVLSIAAILLSAILLSRNLADLVALGAFATQSLLILLGLKKRARVWGTVYDSNTKHPVQFAKVELSDTTGRVLETRFTDRDGQYGFLTNPEQLHQQTLTVRLKASAAGYLFPSGRVTAGATDFLVYEHVYMGEALTIATDSFPHYDIPMDRQLWRTPRFSEFFPLKSSGGFMTHLLNILFWVGLVLVPWAYWQDPSTLNLVILVMFLGVHALRMLTGMYRPFGIVRDSATGRPVPYALVIFSDVTGVRRSFAVADDQGRYFVSSEGGTYELQAHTPANVTPQRRQSTTVTIKSGWIRRRLNL